MCAYRCLEILAISLATTVPEARQNMMVNAAMVKHSKILKNSQKLGKLFSKSNTPPYRYTLKLSQEGEVPTIFRPVGCHTCIDRVTIPDTAARTPARCSSLCPNSYQSISISRRSTASTVSISITALPAAGVSSVSPGTGSTQHETPSDARSEIRDTTEMRNSVRTKKQIQANKKQNRSYPNTAKQEWLHHKLSQ